MSDADRFRPDAGLIPIMGPELLAAFIGEGLAVDVVTGETFRQARPARPAAPLHRRPS